MKKLNNIALALTPMAITGDNFQVEFKNGKPNSHAHYLFRVPSTIKLFTSPEHFGFYNILRQESNVSGKITGQEKEFINIKSAELFEKHFKICIQPEPLSIPIQDWAEIKNDLGEVIGYCTGFEDKIDFHKERDIPSVAQKRKSSFKSKIIITSTENPHDNFFNKHIHHWSKNSNPFFKDEIIESLKENSDFDILNEVRKPNSAAVVIVSNDDGDFSTTLDDFIDQHLSSKSHPNQEQDLINLLKNDFSYKKLKDAYNQANLSEVSEVASGLCVAAKWVENSLHTLDVARESEDDFLITCAEQNLEKARNEMAQYIELFENA